ncbi:MAG: tRNA guanosine(34) transglycosylase Tgt [Bacteroidales bacterium]|nr:tRNA guanosine(34) transglycosylase Tgt [Bacteroidales bacterium]
MTFDITTTLPSGSARCGVLHTPHGDIQTPIFMPVGTAASVKAVHQHELRNDIKAQIILANTYHLYLRPGCDILRRAGGIHPFNGWEKPVLTDSGGFQVFSLADSRKIDDDGCTFRSHIDGSKHRFTPESVIDTQRVIGADIIMAFDECCPGTADKRYAERAMQRTHNWLDRCLRHMECTEALYGYPQSLFPIVQGCSYADLRARSAGYIAERTIDGCAIGGLAVGEPTEVMYEMVELCDGILPKDKPRYLMGVGTPANLLECIARGVDMFDCVMPTRNGRNGLLYTMNGTINIKNKKWEDCFEPVDPTSEALCDNVYTLAYLHHLMRADEILALQICSIHNLAFYLRLMGEARQHIALGDYMEWYPPLATQLMRRL